MKRLSLHRCRRFARNESGAVLVEFALTLPVMLLFLALVIEMSRMLWTYQIALSGVRDASRYLSRVIAIDICEGEGEKAATPLPAMVATVTTIIAKDIGDNALFPGSVSLGTVAPSYRCRLSSDMTLPYRTNPAPVAKVTASLTLDLPMAGIFTLFTTMPTSITTSVSGESRVYGQ